MIVLDTHVWFWWVQGAQELSGDLLRTVQEHEETGLLVSAISLLEVSRAAALAGMELPLPVNEWLDLASTYPGIHIAPLDSRVAVEAYRLPGEFHKDPADRVIVATARVWDCPIATLDR